MPEQPEQDQGAPLITTTPIEIEVLEQTGPTKVAPAADLDASTGFVPSFRPALSTPSARANRASELLIKAGERLGDFELMNLLGSGSFAKVFLARQISLGRHVALKVSANYGSEARTLASLEHDYIVHVFSEDVDRERDLRLLCMQYIAGTTLEWVIQALGKRDRASWSGQALLEIIDALSTQPAAFEASALREREYLWRSDFPDAVCWLGARLAEALAYAHQTGILHRDIKPANILVNRYGRPFLADFNIAFNPDKAAGGDLFGGTLAYMAPEHLAAFGDPSRRHEVDGRSDIYSLGMVVGELLTGERPMSAPPQSAAADSGARPPAQCWPGVHPVLGRILTRCLESQQARRYQNACDLARALDGCRDLRRIERKLPALSFFGWPWGRYLADWPFAALLFLAFFPHFLGSLLNISYNDLAIMGTLEGAQRDLFWNRLVPVYNLVFYPLCLWLCYVVTAPALHVVRSLERGEEVETNRLADARRRLLALPLWAVAISCLGWLPGGILFPLGIHYLAGGVKASVFGHFLISFTMSGLIALTYSFFGVALVVLWRLYPRLWVDAQNVRGVAAQELGRRPLPLTLFQILAGVIPLAGAMLPLWSGDLSSRLLVTSLIILGGIGFMLADGAKNILSQTVAAFAGTERRPQPGEAR
jgi:serine/threonine protein kinase